MPIALIVVAGLLGLAALGSAAGKLRRVPSVIESMHSLGIKDSQIPLLAVLELLGAAGLLVGIWFKPLGVLSAICLALYFIIAAISHARVGHSMKEMAPAIMLALVSIITVALEFAR
jgi:uncharacterized membrane protein YphA (DoxX/SURF4 family)